MGEREGRGRDGVGSPRGRTLAIPATRQGPPAAWPAAASRGLGSPCSPRSPPPGRPQSFLQAQGDGRPTLPGPRARCFAFASFTPISPSYPDSLALPPESFPWPPALSGRCQPHLRAERSSFLARFAVCNPAFRVCGSCRPLRAGADPTQGYDFVCFALCGAPNSRFDIYVVIFQSLPVSWAQKNNFYFKKNVTYSPSSIET